MAAPATVSSTHRLAPAPGTAQAVMTELREFLTFQIGNEEYGVDILRVQEIRSYEKPTMIANATGEVLGVMNLRGVIVPILDLRLKLGQTQVHYDHLKVVIVLHIGQRTVGVVVDGVSDVLTLEREQLRPRTRTARQREARAPAGHRLGGPAHADPARHREIPCQVGSR
ncbi:MAG TPA: chemotaxis protein CheW [Acidovorax sp.]|nr:chemotaxis protein CheW [Acidovorax sp.]